MERPTSEEITEFTMPEALQGTEVSFYKNGMAEGRPPELGTIVRVHNSRRTVTIQIAGGTIQQSVRHLDDPKLRINSDHRENGAWDFTPEYKRREREVLEINQRLARLESIMIVDKPAGKQKRTPQKPAPKATEPAAG